MIYKIRFTDKRDGAYVKRKLYESPATFLRSWDRFRKERSYKLTAFVRAGDSWRELSQSEIDKLRNPK
jgi:hypothetical protein